MRELPSPKTAGAGGMFRVATNGGEAEQVSFEKKLRKMRGAKLGKRRTNDKKLEKAINSEHRSSHWDMLRVP